MDIGRNDFPGAVVAPCQELADTGDRHIGGAREVPQVQGDGNDVFLRRAVPEARISGLNDGQDEVLDVANLMLTGPACLKEVELGRAPVSRTEVDHLAECASPPRRTG